MKKLLLLAMLFCLGLSAKAQENTISFPPSDIQYWVGSGANSCVVVLGWDNEGVALAWGYRWDGNVTALQVLNDITAADSRLSRPSTTAVYGFTYNDGTLSLQPDVDWWCYTVDGQWATVGYDGYFMTDGELMELSEDCTFSLSSATPVSDPNGSGDPDDPQDPDPEDATIAFDAIRYWVGHGENQAVVTVNWAAPDTCLAWGVRFGGSITLKDAMDSIQASDPRFEYGAAYGFLSDILFEAGDDILSLSEGQGNYWTSLINGQMAMELFGDLQLHDGDFAKWGDMNAATVLTWDTTEYGIYAGSVVFTTMVVPVTEPILMGQGPYDGPAGTKGSLAIAASDARFTHWATACELQLGPQDLSQEGSPLVSYGSADGAIGAVEMGNNLGVVSLGDGGMATLTFSGYITNGEGPDFAVFENSFDDYFLELAFVEVSSDGERFVRFPAVSLTQTEAQVLGNGMLDATNLYNLAGKYRSGYGVGFDLEELRDSTGLDINNITHVRVVDVVGSIDPQYGTRDSQGNMVNDPFPTRSYSAGFDLDGVGVLHFSETRTEEGIETVSEQSLTVYPNPASSYVMVSLPAEIYDMQGRLVLRAEAGRVDVIRLAKGIYMVRAGEQTSKLIVK